MLGRGAPEDDGDLGGGRRSTVVLPSSVESPAGSSDAVRRRSRVVVGQVVLVQHDVAAAEVLAHPLASPSGVSTPTTTRGRRSPVGAPRRAPRSRARRLVRPTTTRSVATAAASAGEARRSRRPGAARARPCPASPPPAGPRVGPSRAERRQRGARPGRVGVVGVVEDDDTAGRRASARAGAAPPGSVGSRRPTSSAATPELERHGDGAATLPGRASTRDGGRDLGPAHRDREPAIRRSTTHTSASRSCAETRHTRRPRCRRGRRPAPPGGRRRPRAPRTARPSRISALASTTRSSEPKRSRCTGPMAVITATSGRTTSTARRSPRARRCPSRPRTPRSRRPGAR